MSKPDSSPVALQLSPAAVALLGELVEQAAAPGPKAAALAELYAQTQDAKKRAAG